MEPIKTPMSNFVYRGNGDDVLDLNCEVSFGTEGYQQVVASVWEPSQEERQKIVRGENVKLFIFSSTPINPVWLETTPEGRIE